MEGAEISDLSRGTAHSGSDRHKIERLYRKKALKLNKQLYAELSKNVELHNRYNYAVSVLKKINSQNQDLLALLSEAKQEPLDIAPAESVTLPPEQVELFEILTS